MKSMNDQPIEQVIQVKGNTAARVTPAAIKSDSPTVLPLAAGLNLTETDLVEPFGYAQALRPSGATMSC